VSASERLILSFLPCSTLTASDENSRIGGTSAKINHRMQSLMQSFYPQSPQRIALQFGCLYLVTVVAQLVSLAFGRTNPEQSFISIALPSLFFLSLVTLPACWVGIILGRQMNMSPPLLWSALSRQEGAAQKLWPAIGLATVVGLLFGAALVILRWVCQPYLPDELPTLGHRGVVGGLAVSFGAAVAEEVWFRFGLMTLLVWFVTRIKGPSLPSAGQVWSVILLSSISFGIAHLPQLISYGAASIYAITATMLGNIMVGTLYGWLYWQRGLFAAIIAHFSVDLMLHVFPAIKL
jgi:hypothetical protein